MSYLERYAEAEARCSDRISGGPWDEAVVVPVLRESALLAGMLESLKQAAEASCQRTLAILVVNNRSLSAADKADNALVWKEGTQTSLGSGLAFTGGEWLDCLWIDRWSDGRELPSREGVGTARKIGCDLALALGRSKRLKSAFASTTDADARLSPDYFGQAPAGHRAGLGGEDTALVHRFRHDVTDRPEDLALTLYEIYLRHYVLGLRASGSPYAFHTVGSLIRFRLSAYEMARGFPKREAGEDFYLLDKLAKLGTVAEHAGVVRLVPRASDRVPFGTGAAMARLGDELRRGKVFRLFPDSAFRAVSRWQRLVRETGLEEPISEWHRRLDSQIGQPATQALERLGFFRILEDARTSRRDQANFQRHLQTGFGALKTFQWIRAMSDQKGETEYREGLQRCAFLEFEVGETDSPLSILEQLRRLEETQPTAAVAF